MKYLVVGYLTRCQNGSNSEKYFRHALSNRPYCIHLIGTDGVDEDEDKVQVGDNGDFSDVGWLSRWEGNRKHHRLAAEQRAVTDKGSTMFWQWW